MGARHGKQVGDPVKGAKAMYELAVMEAPPLRVVIGSDAYKVSLIFFFFFFGWLRVVLRVKGKGGCGVGLIFGGELGRYDEIGYVSRELYQV